MLRFLLVVIVLVALLLHNLPLLVRDQAVLWLLNNGADKAQLSSLEVEWFSGKVHIKGLKAEAKDKPPLQIDSLSVDLNYEQLQQEKILISSLNLAGINIGVRQQDQALWLGPIDLNQLQSKEPEVAEENPSPSNWSFGLAELNLQDINWQAELDGQKHRLKLNTGRIADFYLWDQEQPVALDLEGSFNGAPLALQSKSKPLPEEKSSELKVKLNNFPVHSVTAVFLPQLRAHLDVDIDLNLRTNLSSQRLQVQKSGAIKLRGVKYRQENLSLQHQSIAWQGRVDLNMLAGQLKQLKTAGDLKLSGAQVKSGSQKLHLTDVEARAAIELTGLNKLVAKNLMLSAVGVALQQQDQQIIIDGIYARGDAQSADLQNWQASIPTAKIDNVAVTKGNQALIDLGKLNLTGANLKDLNNISLATVEAEKLKVQGKGGVFTQWGAISAQDIKLAQQSELSIKALNLSNSKTRVLLSKKRQLTDLDWLLAQLSPAEKAPSKNSKKAQSNSKPFRVKLAQLNLTGSNPIRVVDAGVKPAFKN